MDLDKTGKLLPNDTNIRDLKNKQNYEEYQYQKKVMMVEEEMKRKGEL